MTTINKLLIVVFFYVQVLCVLSGSLISEVTFTGSGDTIWNDYVSSGSIYFEYVGIFNQYPTGNDPSTLGQNPFINGNDFLSTTHGMAAFYPFTNCVSNFTFNQKIESDGNFWAMIFRNSSRPNLDYTILGIGLDYQELFIYQYIDGILDTFVLEYGIVDIKIRNYEPASFIIDKTSNTLYSNWFYPGQSLQIQMYDEFGTSWEYYSGKSEGQMIIETLGFEFHDGQDIDICELPSISDTDCGDFESYTGLPNGYKSDFLNGINQAFPENCVESNMCDQYDETCYTMDVIQNNSTLNTTPSAEIFIQGIPARTFLFEFSDPEVLIQATESNYQYIAGWVPSHTIIGLTFDGGINGDGVPLCRSIAKKREGGSGTRDTSFYECFTPSKRGEIYDSYQDLPTLNFLEIILDNEEHSIQVFSNGVEVIEANQHFSNFDRFGFIGYGGYEITLGELISVQSDFPISRYESIISTEYNCIVNSTCDEGYCYLSECVQCISDVDCGAGVCESGTCAGECVSDSGCPTEEYCMDSMICVSCYNDSHCSGFCNVSEYECVECIVDEDCTGEYNCKNNVCVSEESTQCTDDEDCNEGEICESSSCIVSDDIGEIVPGQTNTIDRSVVIKENAITISDDTSVSISKDLVVDGNVLTIEKGSTLNVDGKVVIKNNANIDSEGDITFQNTLVLDSSSLSIEAGGNIDIDGEVDLSNGALAISKSTLKMAGGVVMTGDDEQTNLILDQSDVIIENGVKILAGELVISESTYAISGGMNISGNGSTTTISDDGSGDREGTIDEIAVENKGTFTTEAVVITIDKLVLKSESTVSLKDSNVTITGSIEASESTFEITGNSELFIEGSISLIDCNIVVQPTVKITVGDCVDFEGSELSVDLSDLDPQDYQNTENELITYDCENYSEFDSVVLIGDDDDCSSEASLEQTSQFLSLVLESDCGGSSSGLVLVTSLVLVLASLL
eukprot:TRINITY_DN11495_c0_g1_i1.p1 TRINITY_DN11495_c0_g1~~TRINITY_DN11495_c0_g1_i1.p1  ORF type:complete len:984 (-),score=214.66 TRINITY_DN11495_c0_g1_i1:44-2935(-)